MALPLARRMSRLGTETAFEVLARAKALEAQGRDVIHLEIGEPDFDTLGNIVDAGCQALRDGATHYGPAQGLPQLREAIAEEMTRTRGFPVSPEEVLVCPGAKPIMFYLLLAMGEEGCDILYPNPGFPIYESMIAFSGARPVPIPLVESEGFAFTAETIEGLLTEKTRLIILNSPSNPTGGLLEPSLLEAVARMAVERDIWVLSDEIYSRIIYGGKHHSIASYPGMRERTVILDGYSKTYAMTGWRLGYGIAPPELTRWLTQIQINAASCTASFTQFAGVEALKGPQDGVEAMVETFRGRRDLIVEGLNAIRGVSCLTPKGAFYVFPNIEKTGIGSKKLSNLCLDEAGVAVLPGTAFGAYGEGYLRLSYANSTENIERALERIRKLIEAGG